MAWRGSPGRAGHVLARHGEARSGEAVLERHGAAWQARSGRGLSRRGNTGRVRAQHGEAGQHFKREVLDGSN